MTSAQILSTSGSKARSEKRRIAEYLVQRDIQEAMGLMKFATMHHAGGVKYMMRCAALLQSVRTAFVCFNDGLNGRCSARWGHYYAVASKYQKELDARVPQ